MEAAGTVVPAFEGVISSPVEARVEKVLKRPGDLVKAGDEILRLDTSSARLELGKMEDQLARKANEQQQLRISLEKSLNELRGKIEAQKLDVEALGYRAGAEPQAARRGAGLGADLQGVRGGGEEVADPARAAPGLGRRREPSTDAQLQGVELDLATLRKEREDAKRLLDLATTRSDRAGVLTWVVLQEGTTVRRGDVIARIATSIRSASRPPCRTSIRRASSRPDGAREARRPDARRPPDGDRSDDRERRRQVQGRPRKSAPSQAAQRVARRRPGGHSACGDAVRVPKGPFAQGGVYETSSSRGDHAVRRQVRLGLAGYDRFEALSGLEAGRGGHPLRHEGLRAPGPGEFEMRNPAEEAFL